MTDTGPPQPNDHTSLEHEAEKSIPGKSLLRSFLQKRIPHYLGLYLGSCWVIIEALDWIVRRYMLSSSLTDFALLLLLCMIPTVLILAYFHGEKGKQKWTLFEKISIPTNALLTSVILLILFIGKNLGPTTRELTLEDEAGNQVNRTVPKDDFRKKVAIFFFENESADSSLNWLQLAFPELLEYDLYQDIFVAAYDLFTLDGWLQAPVLGDKVKISLPLKADIANRSHMTHFVTGSLNRFEEDIMVKVELFETDRVKKTGELDFRGSDIFGLADEISLAIRRQLGIPESYLDQMKDLPVSEIFTNSVPALKSYVSGLYADIYEHDWQTAVDEFEKAILLDSTFAYAYYNLLDPYTYSNQEEKRNLALASIIQYLYKLPEKIQFEAKYWYYYYNKELNKAFKVVKIWVELYPEDLDAHRKLAYLYTTRNQLQDAIQEYKTMIELNPEEYDHIRHMGYLYQRLGDFVSAFRCFSDYASRFPEDPLSFSDLGELYLIQGDYLEARKMYEKGLLLKPGDVYFQTKLADIEAKQGNFEKAFKLYETVLKSDLDPAEKIDIYLELALIYELRGQLSKAREYVGLFLEEGKDILTPAELLTGRLANMRLNILLGQKELVLKDMDEVKKQLAPPFDSYISFAKLMVYIELENADSLERAIRAFQDFINTYQKDFLKPTVYYAWGRMHEIREEYDSAITNYEKALKPGPNSAIEYTRIGRCYEELGDLSSAETNLVAAIKFYPAYAKAYYELTLVYEAQGHTQKAISSLNNALEVWKEADPEFKPAKEASSLFQKIQQQIN